MEEMSLYNYQKEVVQPALDGRNIIIWLPTGGGKTRAAVYVAKKHLETTRGAKVAVLVNKVHLVDQHFTNEFDPFLSADNKVVSISGECVQKDFFGLVVKDNDVIICTAQILENALKNKEEEKHVDLTDFTLLIIDECHHTHKQSVYNNIMTHYLSLKLKGEKRLPQVLGLTASLGTGGARTIEGAREHVLQVCANLDASAIMSSEEHAQELRAQVPKPKKKYDIVEKRQKDPFGDHLKWMMETIHIFMDQTVNVKEFGTQEYEADVVEMEKKGVVTMNRLMAQCALHLRQYNDALLINDTVRMMDAFRMLERFYIKEQEKRSDLDGTDLFLFGLFEENKVELMTLASDARFENPKLGKLEQILHGQFGGKVSRGIIFTKTRVSTHCLHDWICSNATLQKAGINVAVLTGAGNQASHMTQNKQKETIQNFRKKGCLNLLVSTSVAEEGLDIPECNLVVRYGLLTNEIAMQQASGRARAKNSVYSVLAHKGGREECRERTNEFLEELSAKAIADVQQMTARNFRMEIEKIQQETMISRRLADLQLSEKHKRYSAARVELLCRCCQSRVANGSDIQLIENTHYVNVNPDFIECYKTGGQVHLERTFEDWKPGRLISCARCGREWGMEIIYKKATVPNLGIKNFILGTPGGRVPGKKWKDIPFSVEEFNYAEYCLKKCPDLLWR